MSQKIFRAATAYMVYKVMKNLISTGAARCGGAATEQRPVGRPSTVHVLLAQPRTNSSLATPRSVPCAHSLCTPCYFLAPLAAARQR